jgi:hypothetical protein
MKTTVKRMTPAKAKPGQLLSSHIEYDQEGDGAHVTHMHQPEAGKKGDMWTPGPSPSKKSFGTRMEAHHHMAQVAGVNSEMAQEAEAARAHGAGDSSDGSAGPGEPAGDTDEDPEEERGGATPPAADAKVKPTPAPKRNV